MYDAVKATHGETAGRVAVAFKRSLRGAAEEFRKDPDAAAGNLTVKLLPIILTTGAAGEPEAAVSEAPLSRLEEPSLIKKVLQPKESAMTSGAIRSEDAIRESTGVTDLETPVRRAFGELADNLQKQAKVTYRKMDRVLDGRWDANKNAIETVNKALQRESDVSKLGELKTQRADLLNAREALQNEAAQKGISTDDIGQANAQWRQSKALEKLEKAFKSSVDEQDRVDLASAIKKLKNSDYMETAMGGKENGQRLISRLEEELSHQQKMQTRYSAAQKGVKYGAIGIGLGELSNIVRDILGY